MCAQILSFPSGQLCRSEDPPQRDSEQSHQEYEYQKERFRLSLEWLSEHYGLDQSVFFDRHGEPQRDAAHFVNLYTIPHPDDVIRGHIFGRDLLAKGHTRIELHASGLTDPPWEKYGYTPGLLYCGQEAYHERDRSAHVSYVLREDHLHEVERATCADRAERHYRAMSFSDKAFFPNPFHSYMRRLEEVLLHLDPSALPHAYTECRVLGFAEDRHLEVFPLEDFLLDDADEPSRCLVTNVFEADHAHLFKVGQRVRCYHWDQRGQYHYTRLLDHDPSGR